MLVYVRPSNEALLRARVPGAQDQRGCPSHHFIVRSCKQEGGTWPFLLILLLQSAEEGVPREAPK